MFPLWLDSVTSQTDEFNRAADGITMIIVASSSPINRTYLVTKLLSYLLLFSFPAEARDSRSTQHGEKVKPRETSENEG